MAVNECIVSCKLYRSSARKSAILAAMSDPVNAPLMQQLESYLDDEFNPNMNPAVIDEMSDNDDLGKGRGHDEGDSPGGANNPPSDSEVIDTDTEQDDQSLDEGEDDTIAGEGNTSDDMKDTASSIKLSSVGITGSSHIGQDFASLPDLIKGSLNSRDDTSGVDRVSTKLPDVHELWIYYNDSINLNNVMTPVIEYLNAASYVFLKFNRLARSDNAIVFDITITDTDTPVKPKEITEE